MGDTSASASAEREAQIRNEEGFHFRPIMRFVDTAGRYQSAVTVHCEDRKADGRSPMELLMLIATRGAKLRIVASGEDAEQAAKALAALVEAGFDES
jgi:phosphotransferase system HPr (HPr) family protein